MAVVGGNVALAAIISAARAATHGKPIVKALGIGAIGGIAQFGGKLLVSSSSTTSSLAGVALGAIGASMVRNASEGTPVLQNLYVPIGPVRVRFVHNGAPQMRISVSAYDAAIAVWYLSDADVSLDESLSAQTGTLVFRSSGKHVVTHGDTVQGITTGSSIVVSVFADDMAATVRHERVHVQQNNFMTETAGRALEDNLRRRFGALRWIPSWLELGLAWPVYLSLEAQAFGHGQGPVFRLAEAEAEWFEKAGRVRN